MKKIIWAIALLESIFSFAQDKTDQKIDTILGGKTRHPRMTISVTANLGFYGASFEFQDDKHKKVSKVFNYNYGSMTVSHMGVDHRGEGYHIESGGRIYIGKSTDANEKWYFETLYSYSRLNFNDATYHGIHDYLTPINTSLGYKIKLGKHIIIDPSIGVIWKIEIMSRGNVDNKDFSNWLFKPGVKIGYRF